MQDQEKKVDIVMPPKTCPSCGMLLNPGGIHLSKDVCIRDLQTAIAQMSQLLAQKDRQIGQLTSTSRLAWIMIDAIEGKQRIFNLKELNMPPGAQLHAETLDEGLIATATIKAGQPS